MDMVEVDPKLFVTCRLCLEDMGQYQIVPKVKEEIKYCFDIDVEPFDGLPQLICRKCKTILSEYYATKKIYVEKQTALKINKTEVPLATDESQKQTVSSSQDIACDNIEEHIQSKLRRRVSRLSSSAVSDDLDSDKSTITRHSSKEKVNKEPQKRSSWKNIYIKQFVCRFCGKCYKKKINLMKHLSAHSKLLHPYRHILETPCTVTLEKFDNKPNVTGDTKAVVYSQDRIMYNEHNTNYYIIFSLNEINKDTDVHLQNKNHDNESDDNIFVKRKRKRIKLSSESSNETMVIEQNSNRNVAVENETHHESDVQHNECIKIDDSDTNSEPARNDLELRNKTYNKQIKAKAADYKVIQNIVLMCQNKYMKKSDIIENDMKLKDQSAVESQLQHKVLSIGRKVINNQGFRCTGLLRYLEKRNLNLLWIPTTNMNVSKESNYVRIMTKLRDCNDNDNTNLGWKSLKEFIQENQPSNSSKELTIKVTNPVISSKKSITAGGVIMESNSQPTVINDSAILYASSVNVDSDGKSKLLNKTPVSNPKQLPKKRSDDVKQNEQVQNASQNASSVNNGDLMHINVDDTGEGMPMPIITSTESLAFKVNEIDPNENKNTVKNDNERSIITNFSGTKISEKSQPRIKVKPVSELMPEGAINNIGQQTNSIWTLKQNQTSAPYENTMQHHNTPPVYVTNTPPVYVTNMPPVYVTNIPLPQLQLVPMSQAVHIPAINVAPPSEPLNHDYVILNTVEFPNTKTNSPFSYFKNLLQIHGIILLDSNQELTQDFINLVKYKLQFVQDEKEIVLCLTLLCSGNKFCIKIRNNNNQQEICINNIPAKWQWEVLKSYCRNDVINRLFQSAQKSSQDVYEKTKSFTCLLKSIKFKNI